MTQTGMRWGGREDDAAAGGLTAAVDTDPPQPPLPTALCGESQGGGGRGRSRVSERIASEGLRWWVYQRERFPLVSHVPMIAAFSFCAVSLSVMLRRGAHVAWESVLVAFATCLLLFLQLRIADEFKDFEEDSRFRPYRAVPRGLVSLRELAWVFAVAAMVQIVLALWLTPRLLVLLGIAWIYLALMTREFGLRRYLSGRPLLYLVSHMMIMPLIDLYATGTDWLLDRQVMPRGLTWFLAASFFNGMSIDIGRKIRSPVDEEPGVRTYSVLWGRRRAVAAWIGVLVLSALGAIGAAHALRFAVELASAYLLLLATCAYVGHRFLHDPVTGAGKRIEAMTFVWTMSLYLGLGLVPWVLRRIG